MAFRKLLSSNLSRNVSLGQALRSGACGLLVVSFLMTASGCATMVSPAAQLQAAKSVGIVSAIGDDLAVTKAGLTTPGDAERHISIERWGLDDLIVSRVGLRLGSRFQVTAITYPRASFAVREQPSAFTPLNLTSRRDDQLSELVRTQISPQGLDAYVVITKAGSAFGSRSRPVAGIGIIQHAAVFDSSSQLHALYRITVIDGHTLKVIDKRQARAIGGGELFRLAGPSREIGPDLASAAENPGGSDQLKAAVVDLIDRSLGETLQDLRLVDRSAS